MEPIEVLGLAGVAVAGWALGRASRDERGGPGDRIATAGARASRNAAFGIAAVGTRALMLSAAGVAAGGSIVARGVGAGADMAVTAGDVVSRRIGHVLPGGRNDAHRAVDSGTDSTPLVEETGSGLVVPVDANSTV